MGKKTSELKAEVRKGDPSPHSAPSHSSCDPVSVTRIVKKRTLGLQDLELPFSLGAGILFPCFLLLALTGCACCLEALRESPFSCLSWSLELPSLLALVHVCSAVETSVALLCLSPLPSASLLPSSSLLSLLAFPLLYAP